MGKSTLGLKQQYNKIIARYYKAESYLGKSTNEEFEKWCPEFNKIIVQLSQMLQEYKQLTGNEMTQEEVLNGFKEV